MPYGLRYLTRPEKEGNHRFISDWQKRIPQCRPGQHTALVPCQMDGLLPSFLHSHWGCAVKYETLLAAKLVNTNPTPIWRIWQHEFCRGPQPSVICSKGESQPLQIICTLRGWERGILTCRWPGGCVSAKRGKQPKPASPTLA